MATRQRTGKTPKSSVAKHVPTDSTSTPQPAADMGVATQVNSFIKSQPLWIVLAIASGACAAINGVFAKLTTTSLTGHLASRLSSLLGLSPDNATVNVGLRGTFFGLNLLFNGVMWALFTAALTKGSSTTRVSIINVSANFFVTAVLGWAIFREKLPLGWWMGAALLAAGNVVIGRREEGEKKVVEGGNEQGVGLMNRQEGEDLIEFDDSSVGERRVVSEEDGRIERGERVDAPI